jgi:membrane protein DedA with SNARE-associated domain
MEIKVMPFLLAARMGIFIWVTLALMPFEVVSDWIEEEIEKGEAHTGSGLRA